MIHYIEELLYKHDCVVIPEFGAIVASPSEAQIDPGNGTVSPAGKIFAFNQNITHNDGLLANLIVSKEGIGYYEANKKVKDFSSFLKEIIGNGNRIDFPGIGTFSQNEEGNVVFERQGNGFSIKSYGLKPVKIKARPKVVPVEVSHDRELIPDEYPSHVSYNWLTIPVAAALTVLISFKIMQPDISMSDLNPFSWFGSKKKVEPVEIIKTLPSEKTLAPALITDKSDFDPRYYIVAACFADDDRATNYLRDLQKRGYDASIAGIRHDLYVVAYRGYRNREDAYKDLRMIQDGENISAWVLKK